MCSHMSEHVIGNSQDLSVHGSFTRSHEDIAMAKCKILTGAFYVENGWEWGLLELLIVIVNRSLIY